MDIKKQVGVWIRVSTDRQVKDESPEHHEERAKYYAAAKDWQIVEVYRLDAQSGKSVLDHPETKRMLKDVKSGRISGLIFSKLARLARNTKELLEFSEIFRNNNADLISLAESIDTSTPAGRLFYTIIAAMATWEREEIAERVAASVPIRAKMGKPLGGAASFGYKWQGKQLIVDNEEAPVRKLVYELFLKFRRKRTVASELNKMGYRTRNGSNFSDTTVDRLIRDTTAKGLRLANYTKSNGDGKKWLLKPREEWVIIPCEAIVSEDMWKECNEILEGQTEKRQKPGRRAVHLLSGYVWCTCGKKMYVYHEKSDNYRCKPCKNNISASDLDEIYRHHLQSFLLTEGDIIDYSMKSDEIIQEKEQLLFKSKADFERLRKRISELIDLRINGDLTKESFQIEHRPVEQQYLLLEKQIPELEAEIDFLKIRNLSADSILQDAKDLYQLWPNKSFEEKRAIVEAITNSITIGKQDIDISLAYNPNPTRPSNKHPENCGKRQRDFTDS